MIHTFDLTGEQFDRFEFREGIIAFDPSAACKPGDQEKTVVFMVQGVILNQWAGVDLVAASTFQLPERLRPAFPCPLYLSGWSGKLVMERVRFVRVHLAPVAPSLEETSSFLQVEGKQFNLEKQWGIDQKEIEGEETDPKTVYGMNVYLEKPFGDLWLTVVAKGRVAMTVELNNFIPFTELHQDRDRFNWDLYRERQARCFCGNHFGPAPVEPAWLAWNDGIVVKMAQGIYDDRAFDRQPVLTDALEEAGCDDADILAHCRQPGEHVRGCWVLDLFLGKG